MIHMIWSNQITFYPASAETTYRLTIKNNMANSWKIDANVIIIRTTPK